MLHHDRFELWLFHPTQFELNINNYILISISLPMNQGAIEDIKYHYKKQLFSYTGTWIDNLTRTKNNESVINNQSNGIFIGKMILVSNTRKIISKFCVCHHTNNLIFYLKNIPTYENNFVKIWTEMNRTTFSRLWKYKII